MVVLDRLSCAACVNWRRRTVSVQSGKVLIITGKSFGETNLIVMDTDG
jgi:hypothetical protein